MFRKAVAAGESSAVGQVINSFHRASIWHLFPQLPHAGGSDSTWFAGALQGRVARRSANKSFSRAPSQ